MSRTLFKYTKSEYIESILKDGGRLKLSDPESFNDRYDCYFGISDSNKEKSYRLLVNVAFLCEMANDPRFAQNKTFKASYSLAKQNILLSHKYIENPALNVIIKKYVEPRPFLKNYFDNYKQNFNKTYSDIIDSVRKRALIASLTSDCTNELMWAHYGDKHEGICVEYEFEDESGLLDVVYTNKLNSFDLYTVLQYIIPAQYFGMSKTYEMDPECQKVCFAPFLRKKKMWKYEKETRMIFESNQDKEKLIEDKGVWFYPQVKVKSIYIGCKMAGAERNRVEDICKRAGIVVHHIKAEKYKNSLLIAD